MATSFDKNPHVREIGSPRKYPKGAYYKGPQIDISSQRELEKYLRAKKSFWRDSRASAWMFYCPLCSASRKLPYSGRPQFRHFIQIAITTALFAMLSWPWFEWKGLVSFVPMWATFEVIYRVRVRAAVRCPHCGFDPYLYMVDLEAAKHVIESHWESHWKKKKDLENHSVSNAPSAEENTEVSADSLR